MEKFKVILFDTYKRNVKNFSFLMMVFTPIIVMFAIVMITYFITNEDPIKNTAVISNDTTLLEYLDDNSEGYEVDTDIKTIKDANFAIKNGSISSYLIVDKINDSYNGEYITTVRNDFLKNLLMDKLSLYNLSLISQQNNIPESVIQEMYVEPNVTSQVIHVENDNIVEENEESSINGFISSSMSVLVFLFIMNYSVILGQEIASEKGSKIMEVILSSTSARTHLLGKISGVLLMCLSHIGVYIILGFLGFFTLRNNEILQSVLAGLEFNKDIIRIISYNLVYFSLGVISFILLAAMLASLVSRTEDTAKALQPLTFLGIGGFYIGIILAQNHPTHMIVKILSYIPLFSNYTMPFRIASSTVSLVPIILSIFIYVLFNIGLLLLTVKVYKVNVLNYRTGDNYIKEAYNTIKTMFFNRFNKKKVQFSS